MRNVTVWIWLLFVAAPGWAVDCAALKFRGKGYTACTVDVRHDDIRLFLRAPGAAPYGDFSALNAALAQQNLTLSFAMNAGMYHPDRSPVGYYVEQGMTQMRLLTRASGGNFGLLPNGVICVTDQTIEVIETLKFAARNLACRFASQSGPMLVIDGALHPRFLKDSRSRYIRNGVGMRAGGRQAIFVMSNSFVTLHEFASLFKDHIGVAQALYFDGNASRLFAPQLGRNDPGRRMGPIIGTVVPKP